MASIEPVAEVDARFSDASASASSWDDVRDLLDKAELFWISTVRSDGRPHVTPLPAVWDDGAIYFCTGADEQKGVNLARNSSCVLTTGNNAWKSGLDVVIEGQRRTGHRRGRCSGDWPGHGSRSTRATGTSTWRMARSRDDGGRGARVRGRPDEGARVREGRLRAGQRFRFRRS